MSRNEQSDRDLVYLARAGDQQAFGRLIERYQPAAKSIAIRMVANEDAARELVQEAVLQAFLSLDNLRDPDRFKGWLFGIVINVCRGYLRDREGEFLSLESLPDGLGMDAFRSEWRATDPEDLAAERELYDLVLTAISELPKTQQEAVLLHYYRRMSLQEIAARTSASVNAVKVRLHRARKQLRRNFLRTYPDLDWVISQDQRRKTMVKVTIADILHLEEKYIVVLLDKAGHRILPIWIGAPESLQIALGLRGFTPPRPLTINFMTSILEALGASLEEVRVEALKEDTFYGVAKLRQGGRVMELDARPSDVLALATRADSPIYVGEEVMQTAGIEIGEEEVAAFQPGKRMDVLIEEFEKEWQRARARFTSEEERQRDHQEILKLLFGTAE